MTLPAEFIIFFAAIFVSGAQLTMMVNEYQRFSKIKLLDVVIFNALFFFGLVGMLRLIIETKIFEN